jgi:hypothetical protein
MTQQEMRGTAEFKQWAQEYSKRETAKLDQWREEHREELLGPDPEDEANIARAQAAYCADRAKKSRAIPADPELAKVRAALVTAKDLQQIDGVFSDADEVDEDADTDTNEDSLSTCESFCQIAESLESFAQVDKATADHEAITKERQLIAELLSQATWAGGRQGSDAAVLTSPEMAQATLRIHRVLQDRIEDRVRQQGQAAAQGTEATKSKTVSFAEGGAAMRASIMRSTTD